MKLDTLYKRAKTGKIQYWSVSVRDNEIVKEAGQLGTENPLLHYETISKGKNIGKANETTPAEQAISQAQSDWNKKRDEGYKSLDDLDGMQADRLYTTSNPADLKELLEKFLPQFNTDASGNPKPMLATDWKKIKKIEYPVLLQPKLDGVRCLMIVNGEENIIFLSRSGKPYTTLNHIKTKVYDAVLDEDVPYNFILDGEIYSEELSFQEIIAAVKKQRPESLKLKFRAYDIVNDKPQKERWEDVVELVDRIASPDIQLVSTWRVENETEVKAHHDTWVQEGYEGAMIRLLHGKYSQGQRSRDLLKVKEFDETEYYFIQWEFGQREEDLLAVCHLPDDFSKKFRVKMMGSKAEKAKLQTAYKDGCGGTITTKHFGLTDDGLPRFPIGKGFRDYE